MKTNREKLSEVLEKRGYKNEDLINEIEQIYNKQQLPIHGLSLQFIKFSNKSEKTKERIKVIIHAEALDFVNIENPLSFCSFFFICFLRYSRTSYFGFYTDFVQFYEAFRPRF